MVLLSLALALGSAAAYNRPTAESFATLTEVIWNLMCSRAILDICACHHFAFLPVFAAFCGYSLIQVYRQYLAVFIFISVIAIYLWCCNLCHYFLQLLPRTRTQSCIGIRESRHGRLWISMLNSVWTLAMRRAHFTSGSVMTDSQCRHGLKVEINIHKYLYAHMFTLSLFILL